MLQTYKGNALGNNGLIEVDVQFEDNQITDVSVVSHNESPGISTHSIKVIPELIIENQTYNVDAVTGATITARGIKKAVENALESVEALDTSFARYINLNKTDQDLSTIEDFTFRDADEINWEQEVDVVVVGAGGAGLSAALEAADNGASVTVIEYAPSHLLSNSSLCGGVYYAGATDLQKAAGYEDTPEEYRKYLDACGDGLEESAMTDVYVEQAPDGLNWLIDMGVDFPLEGVKVMGNEEAFAHVTKPVPRSYVTRVASGWGITDPLYKQAVKRGVKFLFDTTGQRLITDKNKRVIGINTSKGNFKANKGVVIASAGFSRNDTLLNRFKPEMSASTSYGSIRQQGDGIRMGMELGADIGDMWMAIADSLGAQTADTVSAGVWIFMWDQPYMYVDTNGKRPFKEDIYYETAAQRIGQMDDGFVWMLWDQSVVDNGVGNITTPTPSPGCDREVEDGYWKRADTIEGLAEQINVPADNLKETFEHYNEMMRNGEDTEWGRETGLYELKQGPYYAAKIGPATPDTAGGLRINKKAQVMDVYDHPIKGLYAAGSTTMGWRGKIYPGCGQAITNAIVFGRIAGQEVAKEMGVKELEATL